MKTRKAPPRDVIRGWSRQSVQRHTEFLQSVDSEQLTGFGYSPTLTLRDCPPTHKAWGLLRGRFFRWLRDWSGSTKGGRSRGGPKLLRMHWVVEEAQVKTKGGVPHIHLALYFDRQLTALEVWALKEKWVQLAGKYGARSQGQHVGRIRPGRGWDRYCAKHASRSQRHYQREGLPGGWTASGRLWGQSGDWPTRVDRWLLNPAAVLEIRRLMRSWMVVDAMESACKIAAHRGVPAAVACRHCGRRLVHQWRGVKAARRVLVSDPALWSLKGLRAWMPEELMARMMEWTAGQRGCVVGEILGDGFDDPWQQRIVRGRERARHLMMRPPDDPDAYPWETRLDGEIPPHRANRSGLDVRVLSGTGPPAEPATPRQQMILDYRRQLGLTCAGRIPAVPGD